MLNKRSFVNINSITLGSVLLLILVGSIVRSLGAGMGCPDWPKCFGEYVPPTSPDQLPDNYLEIFKNERLRKNERLVFVLENLGFESFSKKITNDPMIYVEEPFDVNKAWIEYINRLVGALIGILVFFNMLFSFSLRKQSKWFPISGVFIFVLTGFQGWIGSLVVSTNLLHGFITLHLMLALLMVAVLIWSNVRARELQRFNSKVLYWISLLTVILFIPQVFFGTEVRRLIDDYIFFSRDRSLWAGGLETVWFYVHRSYSWVLLIASFWMAYLIRREKISALKNSSTSLIILVITSMLVGLGMVKFEFPFWFQSLHLILGTGIFSLLIYINLRFRVT